MGATQRPTYPAPPWTSSITIHPWLGIERRLPRGATNKPLRVNFAQRCGLPPLDAATPRLRCLYEGQAPPPGAPLSRLLDVVPVPINLLKLESTVGQVCTDGTDGIDTRLCGKAAR